MCINNLLYLYSDDNRLYTDRAQPSASGLYWGLNARGPEGIRIQVLVLGSWHYVASTPTERNKVDSTGICFEINFILIGLLNN